jgi:hypothetical protein
MKRAEIERLREEVGCAMVLSEAGFAIDEKESTRRAVKFRRAAEIIIVTHDDRGWFDPLSDSKGDVFSLVAHLDGIDFPACVERVASLVGLMPSLPVLQRTLSPRLPEIPPIDRWHGRRFPRWGSKTWQYLRSLRSLPAPIIRAATDRGLLREGPLGSMWAGLGITAFGGFAPEAANDDDPDPTPPAPSPLAAVSAMQSKARKRGHSANFYLHGDRDLAATWKERAETNVAAILLASEIERQERAARPDEQARLIRYTGFGASELANRVFRRPGEAEFQKGWEALGSALEISVSQGEYASLARSTQYAHFTPEFVVRAIWAGLGRGRSLRGPDPRRSCR